MTFEAFTQLPTEQLVNPEGVRLPHIDRSVADQAKAQVRSTFYTKYGKRFFDVSLVVAALPFWLPLTLGLAAMVALNGGKPFYSQLRVGRGGRQFRMWKLRSMVVGADALLQRHLDENPEARAEWDAKQKLAKDPRITRFGRFLRKSSLDELPQLWNVLIGEMSLVGPRPVLDYELERYGRFATFYTSVRPGLTGPWQVGGRNEISYDERVELDAKYASHPTMKSDLALLLATVPAVLKVTGS